MLRLSILCLLTVLGDLSFAVAQNAVFTANASATKLGVKDQIQVDYTISDVENLRTLSKPDFKDFDVVQGPFQRQSSNISMIGNKTVQSISITHSYVIHPKRMGTLIIPPCIAKDAAGHTYQSNDIKVEVVNGSLASRQQNNSYDPYNDPFADPFAAMMQQRRQMLQQMQRGQQLQQQRQAAQPQASAQVADMGDISKNLFIKVAVDKNKAYVGEQVTASYKLYARIPMNVGISKLPSLNGFWTQDFDIPKGNIKPVEEVIDGKKYQVFLLKKSALFPQETGTLTLDPAEAEGTARILQKVQQRNPFDSDPFFQAFGSLMMNDPFFNDDFFGGVSYKDVPVKLKSPAVKIHVLPVPESGKPANYGGAVGQFTATGKTDKTKLTTDDVLTYTLTISGTGNFKLIQPPKLELPNGLSSYDPQVIDTITGRSTTISGSKIITYSITPRTPGYYDIPPVNFSYFNPASGTYTTISTRPVKLQVEKGKNYNPALATTGSLSDIHPIILTPLKKLEFESKPLFFTAGYWSMYAVPLFAFIGLAVWKRKEDELSKDMVKLRNRRANKIALKRLAAAQKLLAQKAKLPFYEEISKAIWLYLSDKLNIPLSALSKERAHEELEGKVSPDLLRMMDRTINDCETALYAPASGATEMQRTYQEAVSIISKLEETL